MTNVHVRLLEQGTTQQVVAAATISWTPTSPVWVGVTNGVLLPDPVTVQVPSSGEVTISGLTPCTALSGWCYRVVVTVGGAIVLDVGVLVPSSATTMEFPDLVRVDPATMDPEAVAVAWDVVQATVAEASAQAAAAAASAADAAATALRGFQVAAVDTDYGAAFADQDGRLLAGFQRDGRVILPGGINDGGVVLSTVETSGYVKAATDADGRIVWAVYPDGTVYIPRLAADSIDSPDAPLPTLPGVALVGHSMLYGAAAPIATALSGLAAVTNLSAGGEVSRTIAARQGGNPLLLLPAGGSIPASGAVTVTLYRSDGTATTDWPLIQNGSSYTGYLVMLDGTHVEGTFSIAKTGSPTAHDAGDVYSFTRSVAGPSIACARPVPFYYDVATPCLDDIAVYWVGRNNYDAPDQVLADLQAMVLRQTTDRWLVLAEHQTATATGTEITAITTLNARLAAFAGRRFIDQRRYLISYGLADAGITPTGQDTTDIAADVVPSSLRADGLHLNSSGYAVVAQLVLRRLLELDWI